MQRRVLWFSRLVAASAVVGALAGGCSKEGGAATQPAAVADRVLPGAPPVINPTPALFASGNASIADVVERVMPSVVNISSTKVMTGRGMQAPIDDPMFRELFGIDPRDPRGQQGRKATSLGSGVIVSSDGLVLTNNHVVDGADEIRVTLSDRREVAAKVVGRDPRSDLTLLRLEGNLKGLTPIHFGDSGRLRLGDVVLAIGDPFGVGQTVTMGIVSAKGRAMGLVDYEDFIQTDAAINPGNSGGALIDMNGQLVGINTAILTRSGGSQGIGFAIPATIAEPVMKSLLKNGKVQRGYLGVSIQTVDQDLVDGLGLSSTDGVLISDVSAGGPAAKAGLRRGDVILAFNGEAVNAAGHLRSLIATAGPGTSAKLDVQREGNKTTVAVTLGELPVDQTAVSMPDDEGVLGGLTVGALDDAARDKYEVPSQIRQGVVVTEVQPGSPAQEAGLAVGDVILEVNRQPVAAVKDLQAATKASARRLILLVYREGATVYLAIQK